MKWKNLKIKYKIFFSSFLVITVILMLVSSVFYLWVKNILSNQMEETFLRTLSEKKQSMELITSDSENISRFIIANPKIGELLKNMWGKQYNETEKKELREILGSLCVYKNYIKSITILNEEGKSFDFKSGFPSTYDYEHIKRTLFYKQTIKNAGMYEWFVLDDTLNEKSLVNTIALARVINDMDTMQPLGIVIIQISKEFVQHELYKTITLESEGLYIYDSQSGKVVSKTNQIYEDSFVEDAVSHNKKSFVYKENGESYQITTGDIARTKLKLVSVVNAKEISHTLEDLRIFMVSIFAMALFLDFFLSLIIASSVTRPIRMLEDTMKKVDDNDLNVKAEVSGEDEISSLSKTFNYMIERINKSVVEVYNEKLLRQEAELNLLQTQINPHFLYNALDSINWMAITNEEEDISRMLIALSKMFRLSLSSGKKFTTIKNEIEHVKSYITIMEQRYPFIINIRYQIDQSILDCQTVKIILQPIIENIFVHGFKNKVDTGNINIRGEMRDKTVHIEVENDGVQVDLNLVNRLLEGENSEQRKSFGIYNVHSRIKISYGSQYGLKYIIGKEGNTIATIELPVIYVRGEENESTDCRR